MKMSIGLGSHLPVLMKAVSITYKPILEIGMGFFSTVYLHWACYPNKRKLISWDSYGPWIEKYFKRFRTDWHEINITDDWDKIDFGTGWGVILIDHGPNERRVKEIERLANAGDLMVIHDTQSESDRHYHYSTIWHLFKYRYEFAANLQPSTSVVSNVVDVKDFL